MTDPAADSRPLAAVFVDAENMAVDGTQGVVDFDVERLMTYVANRWRPVICRAYADWAKLRTLRTDFLRHAFDQVQTTYMNLTKNSLDMQMCVDALETGLLSADIGIIVLVTADSDFSALARTLRRHRRVVVGIGRKGKASEIFRAHCDEFVDYDALPADATKLPRRDARPRRRPPSQRATSRPSPASRPRAEPSRFLHDPRFDDADGAAPDDADARDFGEAPPIEPTAPPQDTPAAEAASRSLDEIDDAITAVAEAREPGRRLYAAQLMRALRKADPTFRLEDFGIRTMTEFVNRHPRLTRDPRSRGPNFSVLIDAQTADGDPEPDGIPEPGG